MGHFSIKYEIRYLSIEQQNCCLRCIKMFEIYTHFFYIRLMSHHLIFIHIRTVLSFCYWTQIHVYLCPTIPIKKLVHMHCKLDSWSWKKTKLVDINSIAYESYVRVKPFSCCFLVAMSPSFFQLKSRHILTHTHSIQIYTSIWFLYIHTKNVYGYLSPCMLWHKHAKAYQFLRIF